MSSASPALAREFSGKVYTIDKSRGTKIKGLRWLSDQVQVVVLPFHFGSRVAAQLEGELAGDDRVLVINSEGITPNTESHRFSISVPLTGKTTVFLLQAIDIFGRVEAQKFSIEVSAWDKVVRAVALRRREDPVQLGLGLGVSSIAYQQTQFENYSELALTAKGSVSYKLRDSWTLMLGGYATALPLSSSRSDVSVRFLGINLRAGYTLPGVQGPWRISINGGAYFASMFVTSSLFGYQGVAGPQVYPVLQRGFSTGNIFSAYAKFSPVTQGTSLMNFRNRELAVGVGWIFPLDRQSFSVNADIADLQITDSKSMARSQSFTLGVAYSW